ncbi:MarR family winged helix-turn-helix transcriptional regulator [Shewanella gelidii]|uniref:Transcriptional regulator n=1 Tax=Shewanella gelidii TaxID=1642821 RepID=A0A917JLJ9_9GAMM|nr:MarR family transcriptional regulator [Shewanella gelidii]MCL1096972.1 MarR family transcriptional regulator [Shewanella gelidii]GGI71604.1 transcriptional regulator [Shewanella gelidii]
MHPLKNLNSLIIEFYDKLSSWEQSVVKETGYTLAQVHTIEVLGSFGPMRMKELAERLGITTGTLTVQIEKLVKSELVERHPHDDDRRSILVGLTVAGEALHKQHNEMHLQLTQDITQPLNQDELSVLTESLRKINQEF